MNDTLLEVSALVAGYGGARKSQPILDGIDLQLRKGQRLALVGESGSGKSTLAKVLSGQLRPYSGNVAVNGESLVTAKGRQLKQLRRRVNLVPQDPYASLNPRMRIGEAIAEAIAPDIASERKLSADVEQLLTSVQLDPGVATRYPHEFSGGQRQRIAIARALAVRPTVLIADEITSALDASVQAEILDLMRELHSSGLTFIFVTHDLEIAEYLCDSIVVMQHGVIVERGDIGLLSSPATDYTKTLVASVPDPEGRFLGASEPLQALTTKERE